MASSSKSCGHKTLPGLGATGSANSSAVHGEQGRLGQISPAAGRVTIDIPSDSDDDAGSEHKPSQLNPPPERIVPPWRREPLRPVHLASQLPPATGHSTIHNIPPSEPARLSFAAAFPQSLIPLFTQFIAHRQHTSPQNPTPTLTLPTDICFTQPPSRLFKLADGKRKAECSDADYFCALTGKRLDEVRAFLLPSVTVGGDQKKKHRVIVARDSGLEGGRWVVLARCRERGGNRFRSWRGVLDDVGEGVRVVKRGVGVGGRVAGTEVVGARGRNKDVGGELVKVAEKKEWRKKRQRMKYEWVEEVIEEREQSDSEIEEIPAWEIDEVIVPASPEAPQLVNPDVEERRQHQRGSKEMPRSGVVSAAAPSNYVPNAHPPKRQWQQRLMPKKTGSPGVERAEASLVPSARTAEVQAQQRPASVVAAQQMGDNDDGIVELSQQVFFRFNGSLPRACTLFSCGTFQAFFGNATAAGLIKQGDRFPVLKGVVKGATKEFIVADEQDFTEMARSILGDVGDSIVVEVLRY